MASVPTLLHTDNNVESSPELSNTVEQAVERHLSRFSDRLTRVEVHVGDVNSHKPGEKDKRCLMEARPGGLDALAVTHYAPSIDEAVNTAAKKLERVLSDAFGKLDAKTRSRG